MSDGVVSDQTGLCIMTDRGWKQLGGPMKPAPPPKQWRRFSTEGSWAGLFTEPRIP